MRRRQSGYRKDNSLFWVIIIVVVVLGGATWISQHYSELFSGY